MKKLVALALLLIPQLVSAADVEVAEIFDRFAKGKPDAQALAFYSLDWEPDLKSAQTRARTERRPVFMITNTNISAGCNFYSGHT